MCDNCPFHETGPGRQLRDSLAPGRWDGIIRAVLIGAPFYCHKTTEFDDDDEESDTYRPKGREQLCAGSVAYVRDQF